MLRQSFPVLLTRPADRNDRFAAMLAGQVVASPLSEARFLDTPLPLADCAIFTSETAVHALRGQRPAMRAWCVGDRTASVAQAAGFEARSASGDADALVAAILASGDAGPFVHLRGRLARGDIAGRLHGAGLICAEAVVYEMQDIPLTDAARVLLDGDDPVIVPLFSPASAARFAGAAKGCAAPLRLACLSAAVAQAAPPATETRIAATPDAASLAALIAAMQSLETWAKQG